MYDGVTEIITGHFAAVVVDADKKNKTTAPFHEQYVKYEVQFKNSFL
jgi:hypothetical protein